MRLSPLVSSISQSTCIMQSLSSNMSHSFSEALISGHYFPRAYVLVRTAFSPPLCVYGYYKIRGNNLGLGDAKDDSFKASRLDFLQLARLGWRRSHKEGRSRTSISLKWLTPVHPTIFNHHQPYIAKWLLDAHSNTFYDRIYIFGIAYSLVEFLIVFLDVYIVF